MRSSLRVLDDVEPGVLGIPLGETLARLHAPSVRVDLGACFRNAPAAAFDPLGHASSLLLGLQKVVRRRRSSPGRRLERLATSPYGNRLLGASSLAEAVWALPAIDAVARRFPGARRGLAATAEVRALLAFHEGSVDVAEPSLIVDLAPGHRRRARLVADVAERLAAARWPWDRLARLRP